MWYVRDVRYAVLYVGGYDGLSFLVVGESPSVLL